MIRMSRLESSELFDLRARGALAGMFLARGIAPSPDQWEALRGERDISLREVAEIALTLDCNVEIGMPPRKKGEDK